jgi:hypothetical protein
MRWGSRSVKVATALFALVPVAGLTAMSHAGATTGTFGSNVVIGQGTAGIADSEPSIRVALDGSVYVGAIKGLPSGSDLWRSDNAGQSFSYLGSPDSVTAAVPGLGFCCAAIGGGDEDFAIDSQGTIGWSSLTLASVTVGRSTNKGASFTVQPLGSAIPGVDREWNASDGSTFYMSFHDVATDNIDVESSAAGPTGGLVYVPAGTVFPVGLAPSNELGNLVADRRVGHQGTLYQVYVTPSGGGSANNELEMAVSHDSGATWTSHPVFTGPATSEYGSVFPAAAIDGGGNLYTVVTDQTHGVLVFSSTDGGTTWSGPVNVSSLVGSASAATVFPWIAAGNGGVAVVWMGASANPGSWKVYAAESTNAASLTPSYSTYTVSDHVVHTGSLCTAGTGCSNGRQLGDFFQVAVDQNGMANVAWADDGLTSSAQIVYAKGGVSLGTPN